MSTIAEFHGYRRADGQVGVRNHIVVIAAMDNSNPAARRIAAAVNGVVPIVASFGRGQRGEDLEQHDRTMIGLGANPNVAAVLVISLEPESARRIGEGIAETGKPVEWFSVQEVGGTVKAVERGVRTVAEMVRGAGRQGRELVPLSGLVLGVECGGSDTTSGVASNPATGEVADRVVHAGGTVILSETTEIIGGERFLAQRAVSSEVASDLLGAVERWERRASEFGLQLTNLAPDNIDGGLSTMEEKSLGAIRKGGTTPLREVVTYAQKPSGQGLVFMDAPAPATENITALAAGGVQVIIFSTGVGNPIGSPIAPTIKVSGNPYTVAHFADNIDVDVSAITKGESSLSEVSAVLLQEVVDVASGRPTRSEILGDVEIAISRRDPWMTF